MTANEGILAKPLLTDKDRERLRERIAKIRAERERRRRLHGPVDVAALVREVRTEHGAQ